MNHTFRLFALGLIGLGAAACTSPLTNGEPQAVTVQEVHPIVVEPQVATLVVRVDEGLQSIARGEEERIQAFAERWKIRGQGMLNVAVPTGSPNQAAATAAAEQIKWALADAGVAKESAQFTSYRAPAEDPQAPITLSFVTYVAIGPECGRDWTENLGYSPRNMPWPEFGCATQRNLAAMISDPRDLVEPKASDPMDGGRRSTVLERYRAGQPTATQVQGDADSGRVSNVFR